MLWWWDLNLKHEQGRGSGGGERGASGVGNETCQFEPTPMSGACHCKSTATRKCANCDLPLCDKHATGHCAENVQVEGGGERGREEVSGS